ncbi:MAG TPA: hypothetical protein EYG79_06450 [Rhodobacteraceae bacterium]|nr:hypothetical protein [Paracoccaceae bacterium]
MLYSSISKSSLLAGVFISALGLSFATSGQAQSAAMSDTDYLSALTTMASDMDLSGLAAQTHEPTSVAAPQLPDMGAVADIVSCESLQAQAENTGHPIEIFGADSTLTSHELLALSKCKMLETGVLVSYLIPDA